MLLEIQIFKTFIILYCIPSKGGKEISMSGKLICHNSYLTATFSNFYSPAN